MHLHFAASNMPGAHAPHLGCRQAKHDANSPIESNNCRATQAFIREMAKFNEWHWNGLEGIESCCPVASARRGDTIARGSLHAAQRQPFRQLPILVIAQQRSPLQVDLWEKSAHTRQPVRACVRGVCGVWGVGATCDQKLRTERLFKPRSEPRSNRLST
jgi:hypothetical protein